MSEGNSSSTSWTNFVAEDRAVFDVRGELDWLLRRRSVLVRAIAEMERHGQGLQLSEELVPDVDGLLCWARTELVQVEAHISQMTQRVRQTQSRSPIPEADLPAGEA